MDECLIFQKLNSWKCVFSISEMRKIFGKNCWMVKNHVSLKFNIDLAFSILDTMPTMTISWPNAWSLKKLNSSTIVFDDLSGECWAFAALIICTNEANRSGFSDPLQFSYLVYWIQLPLGIRYPVWKSIYSKIHLNLLFEKLNYVIQSSVHCFRYF